MAKKIGIAVAIVLLFALLIRVAEGYTGLLQYRDSHTVADSELQTKLMTVRDSAGEEISRYRINELTYQQLIASNSDNIERVEQALEQVNLKLKHLQSATMIKSATHDTVRIAVRDTLPLISDSSQAQVSLPIKWADKWLELSAIALFSKYQRTYIFDSLTIDYTLNNEVLVAYTKKSKLLSKPSIDLTIKQSNPHTTTGGVQTYNIKVDRRWYETRGASFAAGLLVGAVILSK